MSSQTSHVVLSWLGSNDTSVLSMPFLHGANQDMDPTNSHVEFKTGVKKRTTTRKNDAAPNLPQGLQSIGTEDETKGAALAEKVYTAHVWRKVSTADEARWEEAMLQKIIRQFPWSSDLCEPYADTFCSACRYLENVGKNSGHDFAADSPAAKRFRGEVDRPESIERERCVNGLDSFMISEGISTVVEGAASTSGSNGASADMMPAGEPHTSQVLSHFISKMNNLENLMSAQFGSMTTSLLRLHEKTDRIEKKVVKLDVRVERIVSIISTARVPPQPHLSNCDAPRSTPPLSFSLGAGAGVGFAGPRASGSVSFTSRGALPMSSLAATTGPDGAVSGFSAHSETTQSPLPPPPQSHAAALAAVSTPMASLNPSRGGSTPSDLAVVKCEPGMLDSGAEESDDNSDDVQLASSAAEPNWANLSAIPEGYRPFTWMDFGVYPVPSARYFAERVDWSSLAPTEVLEDGNPLFEFGKAIYSCHPGMSKKDLVRNSFRELFPPAYFIGKNATGRVPNGKYPVKSRLDPVVFDKLIRLAEIFCKHDVNTKPNDIPKKLNRWMREPSFKALLEKVALSGNLVKL